MFVLCFHLLESLCCSLSHLSKLQASGGYLDENIERLFSERCDILSPYYMNECINFCSGQIHHSHAIFMIFWCNKVMTSTKLLQMS
jgi:hypothetical protein